MLSIRWRRDPKGKPVIEPDHPDKIVSDECFYDNSANNPNQDEKGGKRGGVGLLALAWQGR